MQHSSNLVSFPIFFLSANSRSLFSLLVLSISSNSFLYLGSPLHCKDLVFLYSKTISFCGSARGSDCLSTAPTELSVCFFTIVWPPNSTCCWVDFDVAVVTDCQSTPCKVWTVLITAVYYFPIDLGDEFFAACPSAAETPDIHCERHVCRQINLSFSVPFRPPSLPNCIRCTRRESFRTLCGRALRCPQPCRSAGERSLPRRNVRSLGREVSSLRGGRESR